MLPRLDTAPGFVSHGETWIKIRWLRWDRVIEPPLSLQYQVEYQLSDTNEGSDWLHGPLVADSTQSHSIEYMEAKVSDLVRNTFYDLRVWPLLRDADGQWTNGSASPRSSAYNTRCSGM